jgi:hypothetical protein
MKTKRTALTVAEQICLRAYVSSPDLLDECYRLMPQTKVRNVSPQTGITVDKQRLTTRVYKRPDGSQKEPYNTPDNGDDEYIDFSEKGNVIEALSRAANLEKDNVRRAKIYKSNCRPTKNETRRK